MLVITQHRSLFNLKYIIYAAMKHNGSLTQSLNDK